ncbi:isochorismatase domain-containing protein [Lasius niger]|uniref:Isochorismatase domain-containing protein n=1 Tax=Lasius niger TaxID=67767 RepID=A0A0J7K4I0_LASNI|nr:isochorismatase domain-containing protein [Lasius niger]
MDKKRKKKKNKGIGRGAASMVPACTQNCDGGVVRSQVQQPVEDVLVSDAVSAAGDRWIPVVGRRARRMALREPAPSTGPLPHDRGKDSRKRIKDDRVTTARSAQTAPATEWGE